MDETAIVTARSHAYLFGVIAKAVVDAYGETGAATIAEGVVRYGRQRGRRMAQRTLADRLELSALNYLTYGEWTAAPGEMVSSVSVQGADVALRIDKCPWHDVWKEAGLLADCGHLYCDCVDTALVAGYNPELEFEVLTNRSSGGTACDMVFRNVRATVEQQARWREHSARLGAKAKLPWDYHAAHLFKTLWEVVAARFGVAGAELMVKALQAFVAAYGREAGDAVLRLMEIDFDAMPPYAGIDGC